MDANAGWMFSTNTSFIGIDPTAGQRPFTYAAIDHALHLLAIGQGDMDEVLAFVAGQRDALVAVSAPRRPNQGDMERPEVRERLSPRPRPGRWMNFRLVEYLLRQHNITIPQTPSQESECPGWMRMGFRLYHRLEGLGYKPFPQEQAAHQWLEVYPHACFTALLGCLPFPKHTLEGRLQRQLVLYEQKMEIADPMRIFEEITRHRLLQGILPVEEIFPPQELDALIAAYTARAAGTQPDQVLLLGDRREGQIVLPIPELKARYS